MLNQDYQEFADMTATELVQRFEDLRAKKQSLKSEIAEIDAEMRRIQGPFQFRSSDL